MQNKSILDNRIFQKSVSLTEDYCTINTPAGFRDITLLPHQQTVVRAMCDIENARVIRYEKTQGHKKVMHLETNAMVLSEPFGTGKTIEILALILTQPIPKAVPHSMNHITTASVYRDGMDAFQTEITRKFTGPNALIRPNLIVVGASVMVQWERAIKMFTHLKSFTVGNYYQLEKFRELFESRKLRAYDIVLVKNGTVSGMDIPDCDDGRKDNHSMVNVVAKITEKSCWCRAIYDDFDTISIPSGSVTVNALFSIYISATNKHNANISGSSTIHYDNILDAFATRKLSLNNADKDTRLFCNFNIRNCDRFIETSTNIPLVHKYKYVYSNPDDNYIRLLGVMGENDANNIMEMLNGDAIGTAAETMGIKSTNVADIFKRMLDKKYEKFMNDQYVLECVDKTQKILETLAPHPKGKEHTVAELEAIKSSITKKIVPAETTLNFASDVASQLLCEIRTTYAASKEQNGLAINRVIDNVKEGQCQICCLPLEDMDAFILRCCGLIVCDVCGIKGCQLDKVRHDYKTNIRTIKGSCANCKAELYPQRDLIFVDQNFNMETLLNARGDEFVKEPEVVSTPQVEPSNEDLERKKIKNPKLLALLDICMGRIPENRVVSKMHVNHLLEGRRDIPEPDNNARKVVVFANFNETLDLVENFLLEQQINYLRIGGRYTQIAETIEQFKSYGTVLLINSQQHCAGINLQFAGHIVLMHHLTDINVLSQVCGRIVRIGRKFNASIHSLCYDNEAKRM